MKIAVCVSNVPDTATRIKIGSDGKSIDPSGVTFIINPYDEYAIEEAIQVRDAHGGEVTVLTMGGEEAEKQLRTAHDTR